DLYRIGVDCLEAGCELRPIYLDRKLEYSGIFMGRVDVFSGGLKVEECASKYEI
ncbi:hypothetical protein A2U01_0059887, partial [Trifolium medium]|nr:hypothetical protein [Trifolium medium]